MKSPSRWIGVLGCAGLGSLAACALPPAEETAEAGEARLHVDAACAALTAELRASLEASVRTKHLPGATAAVDVADCHPRLASGVADLVTRSPIHPGALLQAGSITKSFTAAVILSLRAEGKLSLDAPVSTWVSGVPGGDRITLRQVLTHRSGLFNYTDSDAFMRELDTHPHRVWRPEEIIAYAAAKPPYFAPGAGFEYSNTNYIVAGLVAERAGGRPIGELCRERVIAPARLAHTYLAGAEEALPGLVRGYAAEGGRLEDATTASDPSAFGAAGALVSDASDLNRFFEQLLGGELLAPAELDEMRAFVRTRDPSAPGYGLGLIERSSPLGPAVGHDGETWGFISSSFYVPGAGVAITVLVNVNDTDINGISDDLARIVESRLRDLRAPRS